MAERKRGQRRPKPEPKSKPKPKPKPKSKQPDKVSASKGPVHPVRYPSELAKAEMALVDDRRRHLENPPEDGAPQVGLALSGGGIRSATFSLGVLQAFASKRLLRCVDILSTVSGGSYIGGFLGRLYTREKASTSSVEKDLADSGSKPIRWLREHGRYLALRGTSEMAQGGTVALRNWVALHMVLMAIPLFAFVASILLREVLHAFVPVCAKKAPVLGILFALDSVHVSDGLGLWWSPYLAIALVPLVVAALSIVVYWALSGKHVKCSVLKRLCCEKSRTCVMMLLRWSLGAAVFTAAFGMVDTLGQTLHAYLNYPGSSASAIWGTIVAMASGLLATVVGVRRLSAVLSGTPRKGVLSGLKMKLAGAAGWVLLAVYLVALATFAHGVGWGLQVPRGNPGERIHAAWHEDDCTATGACTVKCGPHTITCERKKDPCTLSPTEIADERNWCLLFLALAITAALTAVGGCASVPFINDTTHGPLYGARLTRAYLGASNPERQSSTGGGITQLAKQDDICWTDYAPHRVGGPLHLVNVAINETLPGKERLVQRDRKGVGLAVGPAGMSAGVRHHAKWKDASLVPVAPAGKDAFRVFVGGQCCPDMANERIHPETLTLGQWIAISGAAVSTGMGARTSAGLSLLCGLLNVRLGYWWNSGCDPAVRTPVDGKGAGGFFHSRWGTRSVAYLWDECLGWFRGPACKHWNLSDGGHFENTGCYELIRRRVPYIVVCDNGQDPDYDFSDLANLVRKARIDFNAEIRFLDGDELEQVLSKDVVQHFGPLESLRRGRWSNEETPSDTKRFSVDAERDQFSLAHAALATVKYLDPETEGQNKQGARYQASLLVLIKPTLTGDEPADVLQYHSANDIFPQQSTADQFFDEAQWESYRFLGEHIGKLLLNGAGPRSAGLSCLWNAKGMADLLHREGMRVKGIPERVRKSR